MITTRTTTKQAATGSLIGLALGDALGFPTEFHDVPSILAKCGPWREMALPRPAIVTDDTQMTLAVARAVRTALARGSLAPLRLTRPLRDEFVDWYHSPENNRAPGRTCLVACQKLDTGGDRPWQAASQIGSKGCGANMRVAPIGLVPGLSQEQRAGAAQLQAALTHGHPTALAASDLTARAVHLLSQGAEPLGLVGQLRSYAYENRSRYHRQWLGDLWTYSHDATPESFIERGWDECAQALSTLDTALRTADPETDPCLLTGEGWIAEEALTSALLCFLLFPEEPVTAIRRAACTKGDSDSIACLAGAFAGAHLGAGAWPKDWADRIEYGSELLTLGALWDA
ncbi:ADP-ribosylglycohydrolase family protein [Streptomyces sp. WAC05374]|uniref:ADP-ribosylglycohydrolase family protein n=1 Tax=Streptomyces sp. WAC05374 TaxID=2487420 RepID=UPI000F85D242|nr:ADP-ribosylglycohydrolase family protein [Streptomyces sp. WAC05374]RST14235.1 ADP-ribosylglycohydrolase family protein [Streptomyces sp. WAC05374]TDF40740.1 ADP-ribosylglycohydrolase family protein [Streptomyces sp. WAC05374]TDF49352.1 ADP-ribosylglycohydrolase family protein [Streptomyces sp. WAC05374]TDF49955.1 ADP-ribosylglycohydrolase family protein [Streptomyces sp. WAC05374]